MSTKHGLFPYVLLAQQRMTNRTAYKPNKCICEVHNGNQKIKLRQNIQFLICHNVGNEPPNIF